MLTEIDPNWRFNTSKKISQLTKVVFHLHSNSMDQRDSTVDLKERYEDEISDILTSGRKWLEKVQKETDNFQPIIETVVHDEFENKFGQIKSQFSTASKKILTQTENLIQNATSQLESIGVQLNEIKEKTSDNHQEFKEIESQILILTQNSKKQIEEGRKKIIAKNIAESEAKYNATLQITRKKEEEMRQKYEKEIEKLKENFESSKASADDTIDLGIKEIENRIDQMRENNQELHRLIEQFSSNSDEHKTDSLKVFKIVESFRDKILENQQKELLKFKQQFQQQQDEHEKNIKMIKEMILNEKNTFDQLYKQKVGEFNGYDQIYKQKVDEYEEQAQKTTEEAEMKNQQLIKEHNEIYEKYEKEKIEYIESEHEKMRSTNQKVISIQKSHQQKVCEIRDQIKKQVEDHLNSTEKLTNDHKDEIIKMKEENQNSLIGIQSNESDSMTCDMKKLYIETSKLKNSIELSKYEFNRDFERIESNRNNEMTIIQRQHEAKIAYLDHECEIEVKEIDQRMANLFEKEKKQFSINLKFAEEMSNLDIKHSIEKKRNELDIQKQKILESERDKNDNLLSSLSQEIESKTIEKKSLDVRIKEDISHHNSMLSELQKEVKTMETNWCDDRQKYINDWSTKFENIKTQLTEEEKQNEDMRKYDETKCKEIVDKLKNDLSKEEESASKEIERINKLIEQEKSDGEKEISRLQCEIDKLTVNRESSINELEKKLEMIKSDRELQISAARENQAKEIEATNARMNELRKKYQEETTEIRTSMIDKINEYEKKHLDLKIKQEQTQLDFKFLSDEFELRKQMELSLIETRNNYELEVLGIEFVRLQNETDRIKSEDEENLESLKKLEKRTNEIFAKEAFNQRGRNEEENMKKLEEKEKLFQSLQTKIRKFDTDAVRKSPRNCDIENIFFMEEMIAERRESIELVSDLIKKYTLFFVELEEKIVSLKERKNTPKFQDSPTIVAPISLSNSNKLKRDKLSNLLSSQRRVSLKDYATPTRKNKSLI